MSTRNSKYYINKCLSVLNWIRRGKEDELRELGRLTGPSVEIIKAEIELLDEIRHYFSDGETLNVFFRWASEKANPREVRPSLFPVREKTEAITRESLAELVQQLETLGEIPAINKAIGIIRLVDRFLAK